MLYYILELYWLITFNLAIEFIFRGVNEMKLKEKRGMKTRKVNNNPETISPPFGLKVKVPDNAQRTLSQ